MQLFYIVLGVIILYFFLTSWLWTGLIVLAGYELLHYLASQAGTALNPIWRIAWTVGKYGLLFVGALLLAYIVFHEVRCFLIHRGVVSDPDEVKHSQK